MISPHTIQKTLILASLLCSLMGLPAGNVLAAVSAFTPATVSHTINLSFRDNKGHDVTMMDFRGHYVLLNLWATWCHPCVQEMPSLDALAGQFTGNSLKIIALNEDHDGITAAEAFYKRHSLTHLLPYADTAGRAPFEITARGLPTTLLIDPRGNEIARIEGDADWQSPAIIAYIKAETQKALR